MIVYDLKCAPQGHVFEAWFGSSGDYEAQRGRGLVACPICSSPDIAKAPMAPSVPAKGEACPSPGLSAAAPEAVKTMLAAAAAVQKQLLDRSEGVGDRFAAEARAIHLGEAEGRPIHGRATREEAQGLVDDGVPIAALPFPVVEPGTEN